jgi:hypothetical protein
METSHPSPSAPPPLASDREAHDPPGERAGFTLVLPLDEPLHPPSGPTTARAADPCPANPDAGPHPAHSRSTMDDPYPAPADPRPATLADRVFARDAEIQQRHDRDRQSALALLAALLLTPAPERHQLVATHPRFASPALADLLLAQAAADTRNFPGGAAASAHLALAVVERIDRRHFGAPTAFALAAAGWSRLAAALWHAGDETEAAQALRTAAEATDELPLDAPERALYCRAAALLRAGEDRIDEALGLHLRAAQILRAHHHRQELGETLAELGFLLAEPAAAAALPPLREAFALLDPALDPWAALRLRQALALAHADLDQPGAARELLAGCRELVRAGLEHPLDQLRYLWTEAHILERLGEDREAFRLLCMVAGGFAEERRGFDAALALLDAADLLLALPPHPGQPEDLAALRVLARKLGKLLPATPQLVLTEALRIADRGEVPALHLLAHVRNYLRAARRDPGRPYAPSRRAHGAVLWTCLSADDRREICRQVGIPEAVAPCAAGEIGPELRDRLGWACQEITGIEIRWDVDPTELGTFAGIQGPALSCFLDDASPTGPPSPDEECSANIAK